MKAKPFEPEYVGKLNFYVNAVDELLKAPEDNPTIGLLICSNIDFTDVQWSFRGLGTPMGVATYNNIRIKDALPSKELLEERMRLLQKRSTLNKTAHPEKSEKRISRSTPFQFDPPNVSRTKHWAFRDEILHPKHCKNPLQAAVFLVQTRQKTPFSSKFRHFLWSCKKIFDNIHHFQKSWHAFRL